VEHLVEDDVHLRELVATVAAAYFTSSHVSPGEIAFVIREIASSLREIAAPAGAEPAAAPAPAARLTPAQIRASITPEALVSFEDNRPYRTLRRHLSARGLTPEAYRAKWGLPADYPMTAPNYSAMRSQLARRAGAPAPAGAKRGPGRGGRSPAG
jgi:predicted transcriptional regulator